MNKTCVGKHDVTFTIGTRSDWYVAKGEEFYYVTVGDMYFITFNNGRFDDYFKDFVTDRERIITKNLEDGNSGKSSTES